MKQNRLRIALQKSGKLSKDSFDLLRKCGLSIFESKRQLFCRIQELPIDLLLVRDDDIPAFVSENICDLGIVGENVFKETTFSEEKNIDLKTILPLGFSKCRLSLAIPDTMTFNSVKDLANMKIATSYPGILEQYLKSKNVEAEIVKMEGSVEVAPHLQISDVICDIVSTGSTLEANGLIETETILKSQALLIGRENNMSTEKKDIANKLIKRMKGVISARESKYVMLNAPKAKLEEITALLPGADSPTIMQLENPDKVAVHAVCSEPVFWETMEELKQAGATAILVMPIEKILS